MSLLQEAELRETDRPLRQPGAPARLRDIAGVVVSALTETEALETLHATLAGDAPALRLAFCNAHVVNLAATDTGFRSALSRMTVLPDGIGVDIGSRLIYGAPFPANLNGTDFIPRLIATAPRPLTIGLLGAWPGVAEQAAAALAALDRRHGVMVLGHGYFDAEGERRILATLRAAPVDLLLVAFGNPRQEIWIDRNIGPDEARLAVGIGALLDFMAGEVPRAPEWLRALRLEWLYRLAIEPERLWRRYVLGNPAFLLRAWRARRAREAQG